jgi:hypothetical protein
MEFTVKLGESGFDDDDDDDEGGGTRIRIGKSGWPTLLSYDDSAIFSRIRMRQKMRRRKVKHLPFLLKYNLILGNCT